MTILHLLMAKGVRVYTCKERFELDDSINSKVLAFAFSLSAEIERRMISSRTRVALSRLKSEGKVLGRPKGRLDGRRFRLCRRSRRRFGFCCRWLGLTGGWRRDDGFRHRHHRRRVLSLPLGLHHRQLRRWLDGRRLRLCRRSYRWFGFCPGNGSRSAFGTSCWVVELLGC